jgi:uncharacterized protein (TIGR02391 family)
MTKLPFSKPVTLIKQVGEPNESRQTVDCSVQDDRGRFPVNVPVFEGDVIELPDPRGGVRRLRVARVKIHDSGVMNHIEVTWGEPPQIRQAPVRRLGAENLHPEILAASNDLFADGHYSDAIFNAFKAIEVRVRAMSGLTDIGEGLMGQAFSETNPRINVAHEQGASGASEQRGFKFLFMGAMAGIRNPKGHELVKQTDVQRTLEYLAFASLLMRRLDDAAAASAAVAPTSSAPTT